MIQPLTQMSIRGALWYQGEANTGHNKEIYDCTFENLSPPGGRGGMSTRRA